MQALGKKSKPCCPYAARTSIMQSHNRKIRSEKFKKWSWAAHIN